MKIEIIDCEADITEKRVFHLFFKEIRANLSSTENLQRENNEIVCEWKTTLIFDISCEGGSHQKIDFGF